MTISNTNKRDIVNKNNHLFVIQRKDVNLLPQGGYLLLNNTVGPNIFDFRRHYDRGRHCIFVSCEHIRQKEITTTITIATRTSNLEEVKTPGFSWIADGAYLHGDFRDDLF